MSVIATAVRHLMAAGVTGEALLAAIAELEADVRHEPKPRTAGAIRQERYRRNKASQVTIVTDVTDETPFPAPPMKENLTPPPIPPDISPRARKAGDFPMLDCTDPATWADFLANRKRKDLPNTATAHRKLIRDLEAMAAQTGWPPGKVFEACVAKGWAAIYDPRDKQDGRSRNTDNIASLRGPRPNSALDMVIQAERELQAEAQRENPGHDWPPRLALPSH